VRALFVYRSDVDADGGAGTVMRETARALRDLDVEVDVTYDARPVVDGYDLVHAFNIWDPATALAQLRDLRSTGLPVVWLPFYLHWCEFAWASQALRLIFGAAAPHERPRQRRARRDVRPIERLQPRKKPRVRRAVAAANQVVDRRLAARQRSERHRPKRNLALQRRRRAAGVLRRRAAPAADRQSAVVNRSPSAGPIRLWIADGIFRPWLE